MAHTSFALLPLNIHTVYIFKKLAHMIYARLFYLYTFFQSNALFRKATNAETSFTFT